MYCIMCKKWILQAHFKQDISACRDRSVIYQYCICATGIAPTVRYMPPSRPALGEYAPCRGSGPSRQCRPRHRCPRRARCAPSCCTPACCCSRRCLHAKHTCKDQDTFCLLELAAALWSTPREYSCSWYGSLLCSTWYGPQCCCNKLCLQSMSSYILWHGAPSKLLHCGVLLPPPLPAFMLSGHMCS